MSALLNKLAKTLGLLAAAGMLTAILGSCGSYIGLAYGDNYRPRSYYWDDPLWVGPRYPYAGQWYGDYVYYRGNWYLYGQGTPYYDPGGWNW